MSPSSELPSRTGTIFYGPVINPKSHSSFNALSRCLLAVGPSGDIDWIVEDVPEHALQDVLAQRDSLDVPLVSLKYGEFVLPGFVDTHTVRTFLPCMCAGRALCSHLDRPPLVAGHWSPVVPNSTHPRFRTSAGEFISRVASGFCAAATLTHIA